MKKWLLALALLSVSFAGFSQTAFTQATVDEIFEEYKKDSKAFFTNRLSSDFRYTNQQGTYQNRNDIVQWDAQKIVKTELLEPVIFQSGDLAVISGIHRTERIGKDGTNNTGQVACTYTFQRRDNKWMFVASHQTAIQQNQPGLASADEAAIKTVLEGHSQASEERDAEKAISYFAKSPNVAVSYNAPGYPRGYEAVADSYRKVLSGLPKGINKLTTGDYRYRIVGNTAFVTYIETYTKPDGTIGGRSHKADYLEKENGQWKMIGNFWLSELKAK